MIELGIPILIIIFLLLEIHIPEIVPLIAYLIFPPAMGFFMVMAVTRHGDRDKERAIQHGRR